MGEGVGGEMLGSGAHTHTHAQRRRQRLRSEAAPKKRKNRFFLPIEKSFPIGTSIK